MIAATVVFGTPVAFENARPGTRGGVYDFTTLKVIAMGIRAATNSARTVATIDEDGVWSSPNRRLADLLNNFFGAQVYESVAYVAPLGWPVEIARDVAHFFGAEVTGVRDEDDEPDGTVF